MTLKVSFLHPVRDDRIKRLQCCPCDIIRGGCTEEPVRSGNSQLYFQDLTLGDPPENCLQQLVTVVEGARNGHP